MEHRVASSLTRTGRQPYSSLFGSWAADVTVWMHGVWVGLWRSDLTDGKTSAVSLRICTEMSRSASMWTTLLTHSLGRQWHSQIIGNEQRFVDSPILWSDVASLQSRVDCLVCALTAVPCVCISYLQANGRRVLCSNDLMVGMDVNKLCLSEPLADGELRRFLISRDTYGRIVRPRGYEDWGAVLQYTYVTESWSEVYDAK